MLKSEWDALLARVADLEAHTHETRMVADPDAGTLRMMGPDGFEVEVNSMSKIVTTRPVGFGSKPGSTGQRGE